MKAMYNQPKTDVTVVNTAYMLMDATISPGGPGNGQMDAPARRGAGPAVPGETI